MRGALRNYALFYTVTSLWWDAARAFGNAALILFFGGAILRVLRRFKRRFGFEIVPHVGPNADAACYTISIPLLRLHHRPDGLLVFGTVGLECWQRRLRYSCQQTAGSLRIVQ